MSNAKFSIINCHFLDFDFVSFVVISFVCFNCIHCLKINNRIHFLLLNMNKQKNKKTKTKNFHDRQMIAEIAAMNLSCNNVKTSIKQKITHNFRCDSEK